MTGDIGGIAAGAACPGGQGMCTDTGCANGTCGKAGQACCSNGIDCTAPFTDCRANVCAACGDVGQRCCPNAECKIGHACVTDTCQ